jgi:hypothetical protein
MPLPDARPRLDGILDCIAWIERLRREMGNDAP